MSEQPPDESAAEFIAALDPDDVKRLSWFLSVLRNVDGWCRINRVIGKYLIVAAITALIVMSQAFDAIRNLLGLSGKH